MDDRLSELLELLRRLKVARIYFELGQVRDEAVMITACVPGERWEIEYMEDGSVEIEVFRSNGEIQGAEALDDLFARFSDTE
jgi:hypothetical protein